MDFLIWLLLPVVVAVSSALLTYVLMRDRIELAVTKERILTREAQVLLRAQAEATEERVRAVEEQAKRQILEKLLADLGLDDSRPRALPTYQHAGAVSTEPRLLK